MSLKSSLITGVLLFAGIGAVSAYILYDSQNKPFIPPVIETRERHQMPEEYECLTEDCWVYRKNVLHCASGEDQRRFLAGQLDARCRDEPYVCLVQDCTSERDIRKQQDFQEVTRSIGERVWNHWSEHDADDLSAKIKLHLDDDGFVSTIHIVASSGSSDFDAMAKKAILETQPFHEIQATAPATRVLLSRITLSFGGVNVFTKGSP